MIINKINNMTDIIKIQEEINKQISNKEVLQALVSTTFKGLAVENVKRAIMEGMMRGFQFKDFLEKNVYAIPFKNSYSLVTSIDYARKIGMRSGVVGTSAPVYSEKDNVITSCTITVKRKTGDYIGEYSATVFFSEYNTGHNLWVSKPRTMIAKVAEMHALRKACPEEMSQVYTEEEIEKESDKKLEHIDIATFENKLNAVKNFEELKSVWSSMPFEAKTALQGLKDTLKLKFNAGN